jgi:hypothetical protein
MEIKSKLKKVRNHIEENRDVYILGGIFAGITFLIVRNVASQPISSSVTGTAGSSVTGTRNKVVMNNVSYISANRQGPPSWVIRCKETGDVFTSQRIAASEMSISETNISKQLNGLQEDAQGYHFERICMAA